MNIEQFNKLQTEHTERVVWIDGMFGYCFAMGNALVGRGSDDKDEVAAYVQMEQLCEECEGVNWSIGYGDDTVNCICVHELSHLDLVVGLEEFIVKWVGANCYTYEDDHDYDD